MERQRVKSSLFKFSTKFYAQRAQAQQEQDKSAVDTEPAPSQREAKGEDENGSSGPQAVNESFSSQLLAAAPGRSRKDRKKQLSLHIYSSDGDRTKRYIIPMHVASPSHVPTMNRCIKPVRLVWANTRPSRGPRGRELRAEWTSTPFVEGKRASELQQLPEPDRFGAKLYFTAAGGKPELVLVAADMADTVAGGLLLATLDENCVKVGPFSMPC